ncbi:hypothetical protein J4423_03045 [Candidatus Pacearchaeota archaeon]|nr:hypothetical protein [Candidatus Pacearchaeota archaeon]
MKKDGLAGLVLGSILVGTIILSPKHKTGPIFKRSYNQEIKQRATESKRKINPLLMYNNPKKMLGSTVALAASGPVPYETISGACPPHLLDFTDYETQFSQRNR